MADGTTQWIRRFHPSPESDIQLVCFPHAGGSATYYRPYSAEFAVGIEVLAVQYPGRQDRRLERFIDNIPDMADRVYGALEACVGRSFALFGHSMGAILAFEVARRFQQRAEGSPLWLFVSGRRAPTRRRGEETVHLRDDIGILEELHKVGGTDPRVLADDELRAMILPMTRNDYKAIETYVCAPGPQIGCPITVFIGDSDPHVTLDEALAWDEQAAGGFDLRVFPGGHFYLDERRTDVIAAISTTLKTAGRVNSFDGGMS